jgi:hemerythrin-like domain-containing protein
VSDRIDLLKEEHVLLRAALHTAREASGTIQAQQLQKLKPIVMNHLQQKDLLYREIAQLCAARGDAGGTQIARIFEDNMRVLSGAVRSFFEKLDELLPNPAQLQSRFRTVADVLARRLDTEEQAVFPIYERNLPH